MKDFEKLYKELKIFQDGLYSFEIKNNIFEIEDEQSGMKYKVNLKTESICTTKIEGSCRFNYLKKLQKCTDAVIITKNSNNYELHVLELKKSINGDDLKELYEKFLGAYLRAMSIIVAYCKITKIYFYLLYENRNNKTYNSNNPNLDNKSKEKNNTNFEGTSEKKDNKYYFDLFSKNKVKNNFQLKIPPFDTDTLEIIKKCTKDSEILEI